MDHAVRRLTAVMLAVTALLVATAIGVLGWTATTSPVIGAVTLVAVLVLGASIGRGVYARTRASTGYW